MAIRDNNALEGMPLKLVIIVMMLALTVPSVYASLGDFQEVTSTNSLKNEAEDLASKVHDLAVRGPGNQMTVTIDVPSDGSFMTIGGTTRSEMMSIGYGVRGGEVVRYYLTDPNVLFITPQEGGMVIDGPGCTMRLKCVESDSGNVIEVSL